MSGSVNPGAVGEVVDGAAILEDGDGGQGAQVEDLARDSGCPVVPLGRAQGVYFYLTPGGEVRALKDREHTASGITSLFDGDVGWLFKVFPRHKTVDGNEVVVGWQISQAMAWLMTRCAAAGFFQLDMMRGPGAWRVENEDGEASLLLHCGDVLWQDGATRPAGVRLGPWVYTASAGEPRPAAPAAAEEVEALGAFLATWGWADDLGPRLMLGWLACALLSGALPWQPHVWLTARSGSGKSKLEDLLQQILGRRALRAAGNTSEAGLRQQLAGAARPVLFDEIEPDANGERVAQIVALARLASTENQGKVWRGSTAGQAQGWSIRGGFYFSSILVSGQGAQDMGRITVLTLPRAPSGAREDLVAGMARFNGAFGRALLGRMAQRYNELLGAIADFRYALEASGFTARQADQLGTLLAAERVARSDEPLEAGDAIAEVARMDLSAYAERPEDSDEQRCLRHLTTTVLPVVTDHGRKEATVAELVAAIVNVFADDRENHAMEPGTARKALRRAGIALPRDTVVERWLYIANRHRGLEQIFGGTAWRGGAWKQSLERLDGAGPAPNPVKFDGQGIRAARVPLEIVLDAREEG